MIKNGLLIGAIALLAITSVVSASSNPGVENLSSTSICFTKYHGQWDEQVQFRTEAGGAIVWICRDQIVYQFLRTVEGSGADFAPDHIDNFNHESNSIEQLVVTARFVGASPNAEVLGETMLDYKCNYFIGNDPEKWHTDVPNYEAVTLNGVFEGINLRFFGGEDGRLTYQYSDCIELKSDSGEPRIRGARSELR